MDDTKKDHNVLKEIGARMRNIRTIHGLRQQQVAEKLMISLSHYSKIEVGLAKASTGLLRRFCRVFKVDEGWLETGVGVPSKRLSQLNEAASPYAVLMSGGSSGAVEVKDLYRELDRFVALVFDVLRGINLDNLAEAAGKLDISPDKLLRMLTVDELMQKIRDARGQSGPDEAGQETNRGLDSGSDDKDHQDWLRLTEIVRCLPCR